MMRGDSMKGMHVTVQPGKHLAPKYNIKFGLYLTAAADSILSREANKH